jgi:excisionase family DNA binding protein
MTQPNVFTPATLAQRWLCSERHVRKLIETGELNAFRVGARMFRIKMEDVERFECQSGDLPDSEANFASHGTTQTASADVIDLAPQTRKRRPASPRLDLHN